ncbi:MAG: LutB/LldF family L-lactate oxidation iron-sulfur protein [Desulfatiglandales bacterium]
MNFVTTEKYREKARAALQDEVLQRALKDVQSRLGPATAALYAEHAEGPDRVRCRAHEIRERALEDLDLLLESLAGKIRQRGGEVHFARDARDAVETCLRIARRHDVKLIVKGKSMVTEEIGLNQALIEAGIETVETDLGEYIIQLAGEAPSHIIAPAIHKTREQIGRLFSEKLGMPYTDDPPRLTHEARRALRKKFLAADMGLSGCNLACAETGHITTLSNEGNVRMSTTLPKVHVAFMGMERIVGQLTDHEILLRLLSHGAAAQKLGGYVSYIGGPALPDQCDGPREFHLIILDNGRSRILADKEFREILCCLRCGACLNVCPVYGKIGGHSYGFAYTGPIGAALTPLIVGINRAADLCLGETLCGACQKACPVNINIPRLLLALRSKLAEGDPLWDVHPGRRGEKCFFTLWSWIIRRRILYDFILKLSMVFEKFLPGQGGWIHRLPYPFGGWTASRDIRPVTSKSFRSRWKKMRKEKVGKAP